MLLTGTAQDPPHLVPALSDHCPPDPTEPVANQQHSPLAESGGSPVGLVGASRDLSGVIDSENTDCSCWKEEEDSTLRKGEEADLPLARHPVVQSWPLCRGECLEGLLLVGTRDKEAGLQPVEQDHSASGIAPGPGVWPRSTGELVLCKATEDGATECGPSSLDTALPRPVPEAGTSMAQSPENHSTGTPGASDASIPSSCVLKIKSLGSDTPAKLSFALTSGAPVPISSVDNSSSGRGCDVSISIRAVQHPCGDPAADGPKPDTLVVPDPDYSSPRLEPSIPSHQEAQTCFSQLLSPACVPPSCSSESGELAAAAEPQNTVASGGMGAAGDSGHSVFPSASCCPEPPTGPATLDPGGVPSESVDCGPLSVSEPEGCRKDLKPEGSLTTVLKGFPCPQPVPNAETELGSGQAVTSDGTCCPAGSAGSESVTKDDALVSVPSQKEKGTTTCGDRLHKGAPEPWLLAEYPTDQSGCVPSMGNASPAGLSSELDDPHLPVVSRGLSSEGDTNLSLLSGRETRVDLDFILTEGGKNLVIPENSATLRPDYTDKADKVALGSLEEEDIVPSGALLGEQLRTPLGQPAPGAHRDPNPSVCAKDKAHSRPSVGTPPAFWHTEGQQNNEVGLPGSMPVGAAQHPLTPAAAPAVDASLENPGSEWNPPLLPSLNPEGANDIGVGNVPSQGDSAALAACGEELVATRASGGEQLYDSHDALWPQVLCGQVAALNPGSPGLSLTLGVPGQQAAAILEGMPGAMEGGPLPAVEGHPAPLQPLVGHGLAPAAPALQLTPRTNMDQALEEAASHIVDAVIEQVKASGALGTVRDGGHMPPSPLTALNPTPEQQACSPVRKASGLLPGEILLEGRGHEDPGSLTVGEEPVRTPPCEPGPRVAAGKLSRARQRLRHCSEAFAGLCVLAYVIWAVNAWPCLLYVGPCVQGHVYWSVCVGPCVPGEAM